MFLLTKSLFDGGLRLLGGQASHTNRTADGKSDLAAMVDAQPLGKLWRIEDANVEQIAGVQVRASLSEADPEVVGGLVIATGAGAIEGCAGCDLAACERLEAKSTSREQQTEAAARRNASCSQFRSRI